MHQIVHIKHVTNYQYDRLIHISPQEILLCPVVDCPILIEDYSLTIDPQPSQIQWIKDVYGNSKATVYLDGTTKHFSITVSMVAHVSAFLIELKLVDPSIVNYPFIYPYISLDELGPFLKTEVASWELEKYLIEIQQLKIEKTMELVFAINQKINADITYIRRLEAGVQSATETLESRKGSCRDTTWLAVQIFRNLGIAARFVSGYLVQLKSESFSNLAADNVELHAWTEVFLPGAGWVGLDATSGLLTGQGHIPLARVDHPLHSGPISGYIDKCEAHFETSMTLERITDISETEKL